MLSIVDLIEAGTMTRDMAAYSLAAIGNGASFMVGALPGGAGKTTVMGALLTFVPAGVRLVPADGVDAIERGLGEPVPKCCYVCHELGRGPYYAYLWGHALRRYFDLPGGGHIIATNLHADTYTQAHEQVCVENRVPRRDFARMNLLYFLSVDGGGRNAKRRVSAIWESDGEEAHCQILGADVSAPLNQMSGIVSANDFAAARNTINTIIDSGIDTIEEVRTMLMEEMI